MGANNYKYLLVTSTLTYHTGLSNRVGKQNQEDAEDCSNLDGQTAWLALQSKKKTDGLRVKTLSK